MKIARFELALFGVNAYVVWDPETLDCAIIDPGITSGREQKAIEDFIARNNLNVTHLVNTHLHVDHAIGDSLLAERYGVPVEAHKADEPLGKNLGQQAMMFGIPEKVKDVTVSVFLEDGDRIKVGDGELEVIHVPGHSPGSILLYERKDGFLIAGDVLFKGSIGRTDLPGGDHFALLNGIRRKLFTLPDDTVVYPGHGPATTIGEEKASNPFFQ